ncbi:purine and uridine phosphorylase [Aulographum hederae CBS 113979]|uniref:Purine and uridine phosphorylase n=1 Tax=Aulographum hederae CBS 113979 TaxID=1176131 RepID=A0A6G1GKB7_9PEZI|nr:purine and uridine phosphorylase [Aulographum hederae CBS 113979]
MPKPEVYTVGWICALSCESVAAQLFLDEHHEGPEYVSQNDNNSYTLGKIGKHNVVIAVLPAGEYGISSAASVARDMVHAFPNVRVGLMVGIGGGAPTDKNDIRLGDVVVSSPRSGDGGMIQYDFGKTVQAKSFQNSKFLDQPPNFLRTAVSALVTEHKMKGHTIKNAIDAVLQSYPRLQQEFQRPEQDSDKLHLSNVVYSDNDEASASSKDADLLVHRRERGPHEDDPAIHYGLIASANQLMKDATIRDKLAKDRNVLCFEMEAAGLMNHFPCLIIRGISDYCDTHKNDQWQGYAAMTAAAYAKELLLRIHPSQAEVARSLKSGISASEEHSSSSPKVTFGSHNEGYQAGVVNGSVSGLTFGRK